MNVIYCALIIDKKFYRFLFRILFEKQAHNSKRPVFIQITCLNVMWNEIKIDILKMLQRKEQKINKNRKKCARSRQWVKLKVK